jgi:deazaflavin-dependent oxidoreductase (nitroreductase family)
MGAQKFDAKVIEQFRAGGEVDGFRRRFLLLLTTTGESSGQPRTSPMMHLPTEDGVLVIASANAAPEHPQWFNNLYVQPRVHVETPDGEFDADAVVLEGERRQAAWESLVKRFPFYKEHQAKVQRELPLVMLVPVSQAPVG